MFAALAVLALGGQTAAPSDVKVRYENAGASAAHVLADISAATGASLTVSPETAEEVLCIRSDGDSLHAVMDRIAWAVDGEWRPTNVGFRLVRTAERQEDEQLRDAQLKNGAYHAGQQRETSNLERQVEFTPENALTLAQQLWPPGGRASQPARPAGSRRNQGSFRSGVQLTMPIGRAIERIQGLFASSEIAEIPADTKVVYSNRPTASQRALSVEQVDVLRDLLSEQSIWAAAARRAQQGDPDYQPSMGPYGPLSEALTEHDIGKVDVIVTKPGSDISYVNVTLLIADPQGKLISQAATTINPDWIAAVGKVNHAGDHPVPRMPMPPDVTDLFRAMRWRAGAPALPAATVNLLRHPEDHDPLGLTAGRLLLLGAQTGQRSLVADLTDDALEFVQDAKQFDFAAFVGNLQFFKMERNPATDWVGLRPRMAAYDRALRANRKLMGEWLRRTTVAATAALEDEAPYWLRLPDPTNNPLPLWVRNAITPDFYSAFPDIHTMRFFGQLSEDQRTAAQHGGISFSDLSPDATDALTAILFSANAILSFSTGRAGDPRLTNLFFNGIYREPTEALPNGVTGTGQFQLRIDKAAVVELGAGPGTPRESGSNVLTAQQFAWSKFVQSHPAIFGTGATQNAPPLKRATYGTRADYHLQFQFTPEIWMFSDMDSMNFPPEDEAFADLPEGFRNEVDRMYRMYADSYANVRVGGQSGVNPPP